MRDKIAALMARKGVRNASWILAGQGFNLFIQAGYFVLLARLLGATEYGVFAGVFALVNIFSPYTALGCGILYMRYVTQDRKLAPVYWGNSILLTAGMTAVFCLLGWAFGPALTHGKGMVLILANVIANCLFAQIINTASRIFQTYERMVYTSFLTLLSNASRLVVLIVMFFFMTRANATQWSLAYLTSSGVACVLAMVLAQRVVGGIAFAPGLVFRRLWEGLTFSVASTTVTLYNDFDKTIMSRDNMNTQNGFYTLGYRVIDFATTPMIAMDTALLPRYFQLSSGGVMPVVRKAFKSIGISSAIGIAIAAGLWVIAPFIPHLVGRDFGSAVTAIRWLCLIPMLRGIHMIAGGALTGSGRQHVRMWLQVAAAGWNVGLNLWLIPAYGWMAACWTSLASDGLLALLTLAVLTWLGARHAENTPAMAEAVAQTHEVA